MEEKTEWYESSIKDIIQKNKTIKADDQEMFYILFHTLEKKQKELLENIEKKQEMVHTKAKNSYDSFWNIGTILINSKELIEMRTQGFYEVIKGQFPCKEYINFGELKSLPEQNCYFCGTAFLNCHYSDISKVIKKAYQAKVIIKNKECKVTYYLSRCYGYIDKEEIIKQTASQYHIQRPYIYSPMARRAVMVQIDFGDYKFNRTDEVEIDLCLKENNLDQILLLDKLLVWNIEIIEKEDLPRKEVVEHKMLPYPWNNDKHYIVYEFKEGNNENGRDFFYAKFPEKVLRISDKVYVASKKDNSLNELEYCKLVFHDMPRKELLGEQNYFFQNDFRKDMNVEKIRVCTKADIRYVVDKYKKCDELLEVTTEKNNYKEIAVYDEKDSYGISMEDYLKSRSISYLVWKKDTGIFFEDAINYLIAFLEKAYPEFQWKGVV